MPKKVDPTTAEVTRIRDAIKRPDGQCRHVFSDPTLDARRGQIAELLKSEAEKIGRRGIANQSPAARVDDTFVLLAPLALDALVTPDEEERLAGFQEVPVGLWRGDHSGGPARQEAKATLERIQEAQQQEIRGIRERGYHDLADHLDWYVRDGPVCLNHLCDVAMDASGKVVYLSDDEQRLYSLPGLPFVFGTFSFSIYLVLFEFGQQNRWGNDINQLGQFFVFSLVVWVAAFASFFVAVMFFTVAVPGPLDEHHLPRFIRVGA